MDVSEVRALDVKIARMLGFDAHVSEDIVCVGRMDYQYEYMLVDKGHYKDYVPVPEYHTDTNAAMTLLDTVDYSYTPRLVRMLGSVGHYWKCVIMPNIGDGETYEATTETPAEAICAAYIAYKATR